MRIWVVLGVALAATPAVAGDGVVLEPGDSLSVGGRKVFCAPEREPAHGVALSVGDSITVDGRRIECRRAGGGGGGAVGDDDHRPDRPRVEVTSHVDRDCLHSLYMKVDGKVPETAAPGWAAACRTVDVAPRCAITSSADDPDCFHSLYMKIDGRFSDTAAGEVTTACRKVVASCPIATSATPVTSKVDLDCLHRLYLGTSGRPSVDGILGWLDRCRSAPRERCTAVGGGPDNDCVHSVYMKISGKLTPRQAADVARGCRKVEQRCR